MSRRDQRDEPGQGGQRLEEDERREAEIEREMARFRADRDARVERMFGVLTMLEEEGMIDAAERARREAEILGKRRAQEEEHLDLLEATAGMTDEEWEEIVNSPEVQEQMRQVQEMAQRLAEGIAALEWNGDRDDPLARALRKGVEESASRLNDTVRDAADAAGHARHREDPRRE